MKVRFTTKHHSVCLCFCVSKKITIFKYVWSNVRLSLWPILIHWSPTSLSLPPNPPWFLSECIPPPAVRLHSIILITRGTAGHKWGQMETEKLSESNARVRGGETEGAGAEQTHGGGRGGRRGGVTAGKSGNGIRERERERERERGEREREREVGNFWFRY